MFKRFLVWNAEGASGGGAGEAPASTPAAEPPPAPEVAPISAEAPPAAPPEAPAPTPTVPPAVISRIGELTRKNRELAEQLAAQQAAQSVQSAPQVPPQAMPPQGQFYPAEEIQRQAALLAEQNAWNAKAEDLWNKGTSKFNDFGVQIGNMSALLGGNIPRPLTEAALATGDAETVLYELSKDLGETARIALLPPSQQGVEIAKFAQKVKTRSAPQVSGAPAPITPQVGGAGTVSPTGLSDDLPIEEWMSRRNKSARV
jgi:hypothetical protein